MRVGARRVFFFEYMLWICDSKIEIDASEGTCSREMIEH
jgi:hypothetical protein